MRVLRPVRPVDNCLLAHLAGQSRAMLSTAHRLSPAGHRLWRSSRCVQFEVGPHRVMVDGVSEGAVRALLDPAAAPTPELLNLRRELGERGYLCEEDEQFRPPSPRLAAELTAL